MFDTTRTLVFACKDYSTTWTIALLNYVTIKRSKKQICTRLIFLQVCHKLRLVTGCGARQPTGNAQHLLALGVRRRDQAATKGQEVAASQESKLAKKENVYGQLVDKAGRGWGCVRVVLWVGLAVAFNCGAYVLDLVHSVEFDRYEGCTFRSHVAAWASPWVAVRGDSGIMRDGKECMFSRTGCLPLLGRKSTFAYSV